MIRLTVRAGIDPLTAERLELWELAAACNLDLVETVEDRNLRELADEHAEVYEAEYWGSDEGRRRLEAIQRRAGRRSTRGRRN